MSILHKIKRKTANYCLYLPYELPPKTRYEGKIKKMKRGRGRRHKQLLNDLMEKREIVEFKGALNGTLRRTL